MIGSVDFPAAGTITFLFTDLEGSTRLWEEFPEAMKGAVERHDQILRTAVETSGGQVVKTTGDGMMAVFAGAGDAATASIHAQRDLALEPWAETGPLRARMGIHAGQADERNGDFFGPTVNRTARIMAVGHGGQVLLSASAAALLEERSPDGVRLQDLGEHRLKDLGRPEQIFQLVHPDLSSSFPPLAAQRSTEANLPTRAAEIIGREDELAEIRHRLEDPSVRLLTLIGPGGTGKTTLAIQVASDLSSTFAGSVAFVDLSKTRDTSTMLVAIGRAVGLDETVDRPLLEELTAWLRTRRLLLVLDNFEQVTEAAGAVTNLVRDCPGLTVLATSRQALRVRAEHVYPVAPLSLPPAGPRHLSVEQISGYEAVRLFVDRARAVQPDFEMTDANAPAVVEICRRLDGLPLAIELAAARLRLFSPEVLRDRLGNSLDLLRSGPRDLPERQQTLRATMDWSYELLGPAERQLFEFLAVFAEAEVVAIEAVVAAIDVSEDVGGAAPDVLDALGGLIEKSLLKQVDVPGGEPRVTMLETIREFAADRLDQGPVVAALARRAHAAHFADVAERLRGALTGNGRDAALVAMTADLPNLRLAWRHWLAAGDLEQLNKLADSLLILYDARSWYLDTVNLTTDLLEVLEASASSPDRTGQEIALRITLARALMTTKGFTQEVEEAFVGAMELFERGTEVRQQFSVLRGLASLYQFRAQFGQAKDLAEQILALGERERDDGILIDGHLLLGADGTFRTGLQGGLEHLDKAIGLFTAGPIRARTSLVANDPRVACYTTSAFALWMLGYPDRAVERTDAALDLAVTLAHPITSAYARFHSGLLHQWRREPDIALERGLGLLEIAEEFDFGVWTAVGTCLLGAAQVSIGRTDEGLVNLRKGLDLYQGRRSPPVFWPMLLFLSARAHHEAGRSAEGLGLLEAGIEMMSAGEGTTILPEFLILNGDLFGALGSDIGGGPAGAEPWYLRAHDRAVATGARMAQLRAATRLARFRQADGEPDAAAGILEPIYATFTEAFATPDLLEAKALLAAVRSTSGSR